MSEVNSRLPDLAATTDFLEELALGDIPPDVDLVERTANDDIAFARHQRDRSLLADVEGPEEALEQVNGDGGTHDARETAVGMVQSPCHGDDPGAIELGLNGQANQSDIGVMVTMISKKLPIRVVQVADLVEYRAGE